MIGPDARRPSRVDRSRVHRDQRPQDDHDRRPPPDDHRTGDRRSVPPSGRRRADGAPVNRRALDGRRQVETPPAGRRASEAEAVGAPRPSPGPATGRDPRPPRPARSAGRRPPDIPPSDRRLVRTRRWPRRILVAVNVVSLLALVGSGLAYGYVKYRLGGIRTGSGAHLAAAGAGQPENILLIGNETRAGQTQVQFGSASELTGTLSDVIMVLHLDPQAGTASILSIPRDVFVPMPAGSPVGSAQKVDAALNDGAQGPNNLARAITEDWGIPINHYVEVDFDGFLNTVNALGGIKVYFPEKLHDLESNLNIDQTGCQLLNGQGALALVRSRHLQYDAPGSGSDPAYWPQEGASDLARIARDHTFVRILVKTAQTGALTNPLRTNAFLGDVLDQLTIDPSLKGQLLSLAAKYRHINPAAAPETTIPVTQELGSSGDGYVYNGNAEGDVEFPDEPADMNTIEQWDPTALPKPVAPSAVQVFNIVGSADLAGQTGAALKADGLPVTTETDGAVPATQSETVVQYHTGQLAQGLAVFRHLSGAVVLQSLASVAPGTVDVQAGTTFAVMPPPGAAPAPGSTSSSSGGSGSPSSGSPSSGSSSSGAAASGAAASVPTPDGQTPSSSQDVVTSYNPRPC